MTTENSTLGTRRQAPLGAPRRRTLALARSSSSASSAARSTARPRPIPERVVTADGATLMTKDDILDRPAGLAVRPAASSSARSGATAPTRPPTGRPTGCTARRPRSSTCGRSGSRREGLRRSSPPTGRPPCARALVREMRANTFDAATGAVTISADRAEALDGDAAHYDALFGGAPALHELREDYAMSESTVPDAARRKALTAFFFWTSWAATTERPGQSITYTNNWPHEPLVENLPSGANVVWSIVCDRAPPRRHRRRSSGGAPSATKPEPPVEPPAADPFAGLRAHALDARRAASTSAPSSRSSPCRSASARSPRTTRSRARRFFGLPLGRLAPLRPHPHLARPDRRLLDRHGLPRGGPLPRPGRSAGASRGSSASA